MPVLGSPGSPDKIPVQDVVATQHLRCNVNGELPVNSTTFNTVVMDIYTGWILVQIGTTATAGIFGIGAHNDVARNSFVSFVPLGSKTGDHFDVQGYPDGTTAIVSASPASFEISDTESTCAIDSATVRVQFFPEFSARVLVLTANYAIQSCMLDRVAYQVTVFAPPANAPLFQKVALPKDAIVRT